MQEQSPQHTLPSLITVSVTSNIRRAFDLAAGLGASGQMLRGLSIRSRHRYGAVAAGRFKSGMGAEIAVMLIILIMMTALCLGMNPSMYKTLEKEIGRVRHRVGDMFPHGKAKIESRPAAVLLVSSHDRDYVRAVGTLSPRGVPVVRAPDGSAGLRMLSDVQFSAGMLVVDGELRDMKELVQQSKQRFPKLTVLVLDRTRDPVVMAAALMTYAERAHRP